MPDVAGPSKKLSSAVAKQRSKRTTMDSSDDASEEFETLTNFGTFACVSVW